ncbi:hypothetical protein HDU96_010577 [Phlyctochytrium bullatum]|nr:hypothetical protein HDU96_010577 [Phlyctochytrium bullatum]
MADSSRWNRPLAILMLPLLVASVGAIPTGTDNLNLQKRNIRPVVVEGSAMTYEDCEKLREVGNKQCRVLFPEYRPDGGPTSGECITLSSNMGDVCVRAIDLHQMPYKYWFQYPTATPPPPPTPSGVVVVEGSAASYEDCGKLREMGNKQCATTFPQYRTDGGPTSGDCITLSSKMGDVCVRAIDAGQKTYRYWFRYPIPTPNSRAIVHERNIRPAVVEGSAASYADCAKLREMGNKQCTELFLPYRPDGGPTSGDCLTLSSQMGDACVRAIDAGQPTYRYWFTYPAPAPTSSAAPTAAATPHSRDAEVRERNVRPVMVRGTAFNYEYCGYLRAAGNEQCMLLTPYRADGGPTSGDCITKSAAKADECIRAFDHGEKTYEYYFQYPASS